MIEEIKRVHEEWHASLFIREKEEDADMEEINKILQASVDKGRKLYNDWLIEKT